MISRLKQLERCVCRYRLREINDVFFSLSFLYSIKAISMKRVIKLFQTIQIRNRKKRLTEYSQHTRGKKHIQTKSHPFKNTKEQRKRGKYITRAIPEKRLGPIESTDTRRSRSKHANGFRRVFGGGPTGVMDLAFGDSR